MDEYQEAAWVTERIAARRAAGRVAVLFRMNAQSRLFEEGLLRLRLPYLVVGGVGFYERKEVKDVLAYLRLVHNPAGRGGLPARGERAAPRHRGEDGRGDRPRRRGERRRARGRRAVRLVDEAALPSRALVPLRQFRETSRRLREEASPDGGLAAGCAA